MKIKQLLSKIFHFRSNTAIHYQDLFLPDFRSNENLNNNSEYLQSAIEQVEHLEKLCNLSEDTKLLDFGCGQGRLVNGIQYLQKNISIYTGIDTDGYSIRWCNKWLTNYGDIFSFIYLPAFNARYNKNADGLTILPFENKIFNIVFLNSVFSHMLSKDIIFYLNEFNRVLIKGGRVYLTAFIEEGVVDVEENPNDYIDNSSGRLHRVRYEKDFFFKLVEDAGFKVNNFLHQEIKRTKQSVLIIEKL